MPCALRISDAVSLGMHAMALLASERAPSLSTRVIARSFGVSEAHLSKVMQRLVRAGLLTSSRGPKGGFALAGDPGRVTLLDVFQAIEGAIEPARCTVGLDDCNGRHCILGSVLVEANERLVAHLSATRLSDLRRLFEGRKLLANLGAGATQGD